MRVSCQQQGAVWRVGLEPGPSGKVLVDPPGVAALGALLDKSESDPACRVLLLCGTTESFCEGLDIEAALKLGVDEISRAVHEFAACLRKLCGARRLVVAVVEGVAAGGGVGLAAAADVLVATTHASFVLPELSLGLLPAVVLPVLLERMPPQQARLLAFSERLDAERALALGLVDRLVSPGDDLQRVLRVAIKHALRLDPRAVSELKQLSSDMAGLELGAALERGAARTAALLGDPARTTPLRAFLEGEPLPWFDRWQDG